VAKFFTACNLNPLAPWYFLQNELRNAFALGNVQLY
jgi:hypothetical protein